MASTSQRRAMYDSVNLEDNGVDVISNTIRCLVFTKVF